jgi:hypothetical protein
MNKAIPLTAAVLLLSLSVPARGQEAYTENVVIVLDASGSMSEAMRDAQGKSVRKMDAAKSALLTVLKGLPPSTHIGLLVFSAGNIPAGEVWVYPLGPRDDARLTEAVNRPQPGDGTPLGTYIKIGADRLLQEREKQHNYGSYRLLVVTDGETNQEPPDLLDKVTKDLKARIIRLDVIGVAMAERHTLATKANSYRSANNPEALLRAVKEVLAESLAGDDGKDPGENAYAQLAGIPDGMASAMLRSVSKMPNQPIGESPAVGPAKDVEQNTAQQVQAISNPGGGGSSFPWWILIPAFAAVFAFLIARARRRARS